MADEPSIGASHAESCSVAQVKGAPRTCLASKPFFGPQHFSFFSGFLQHKRRPTSRPRGDIMKKRAVWFTKMTLFAVLAITVPVYAGGTAERIVTFDAPGAGTASGQGTSPLGINDRGDIIGNYVDASFTTHGFLRTEDGNVTTVDPPDSVFTVAYGINLEGAITGFYIDGSLVAWHSYLRTPDGKFTIFDAPGAGAVPGQFQGTFASNINLFGEISGNLQEANNAFECFVRARDGTFTTFIPPGAGTGAFQGCNAFTQDSLNDVGATAGWGVDDNFADHGWVRAPDGKITTFDVPGGGTGAGQGTVAGGINLWGTIAGWLIDSDSVYHGFVRTPHGDITNFDVKGAGTSPGQSQGTFFETLNIWGAITGQYVDGNNVNHGFVRTPDGEITTFDIKGAGTGRGQGTIGVANNALSEIAGIYYDANSVAHGFLRR
jgi:hypothetical protein